MVQKISVGEDKSSKTKLLEVGIWELCSGLCPS